MTTVKDIYDFLDKFCPFKYCLDFDNVGILLGKEDDEVLRALIALDVVDEVIQEAKNLKVNLIITHHPIIFKGLKSITDKSLVYKLLRENISVISAHTNLDIAKNGVNFHLAKALSLCDLSPLSFAGEDKSLPLGFVGYLKTEMKCKEFAEFAKKRLSCKGLRYINIPQKAIKKVAVGSGACGDLIYDAAKHNADAFLTGEIKHHELLYAKQNNICVVDAGHYKSENIIAEPLVKNLSEYFPSIKFFPSHVDIDSINYI
ncbi:MAG: Nif3-like dinuclear metal center hexameric protein [Clostridia bacterium]|nr:Nif3-like dinuclear metal center hexameric protein [Clostridia bacterium]